MLPIARSPVVPKLYNAPAFDEPVPLLYVVRVEYHPSSVALSVHAIPVPVLASESTGSGTGAPSDEIATCACADANMNTDATETSSVRLNRRRAAMEPLVLVILD